MTQPIHSAASPPTRRGFLEQISALVVGSVITLFPLGAGLFTFCDPLRRKSALGSFLRVARLDALPADGRPRRFSAVAQRTDAWNHFPPEPIGLVYLRRTADGHVTALNGACPHAGCIAEFRGGADDGSASGGPNDRGAGSDGGYHCPCHDSRFAVDGVRVGNNNPAPRDMDALEVDPVRLEQGEVWVRFENFVAGKADKVVAT